MSRLARHIPLLVAALFLLMQGVAVAHVSANGGPHDHDGVACSVTLLAEDEAVAPEPLLISEPVPVEHPVPVFETPQDQPLIDCADARAPPPRGPPL